MVRKTPYPWKRYPFIRLIMPLISGILVQYYSPVNPTILIVLVALTAFLVALYYMLSFRARYTYRWLTGFTINVALLVAGTLLVVSQDIRNKEKWIGNLPTSNYTMLITVKEPLIRKAKTYKAECSVDAVLRNGQWTEVEGNILAYFSADSSLRLHYGSRVLSCKKLQPVSNLGNPGGFDYKQYNGFKNIYHQVFLRSGEYVVASSTHASALKTWLFSIRNWVIKRLRRYIQPAREAGVAEALLIGFRDDLDKELVQAYSNTGVVHIIAISGLHLGMIYLALVWLMAPFKKTRWIRYTKPVLILAVLWIFTLLAGAVPSILRSAIMFSFIIIGETVNRRSSIYNTLASSAFVMLCVNPYFLWDVGFQLSYAAVISIVAFSKPVYNWFYFRNKLLDFSWRLASVTLAAQLLTIPIIFYVFHQFPVFFLLTNWVVVPLSSLVLFAELILLVVSGFPTLPALAGSITGRMLAFMDHFVESVNVFPGAVYDGIQISLLQTILLYLAIISVSYWLLNKNKKAFFTALTLVLFFMAVDGIGLYKARRQRKMVVYNIPNYSAVDFINGTEYAFTGDSVLAVNVGLKMFHLQPSRTFYRVSGPARLTDLYISYPFIQFAGKRILLINKTFKFESTARIPVDLIVMSHNPGTRVADINAVFDCKQFVFDGSNASWKINQWKKDCDSLHLRNFSTSDMGAYEVNL
jgi:competence protein ComEC